MEKIEKKFCHCQPSSTDVWWRNWRGRSSAVSWQDSASNPRSDSGAINCSFWQTVTTLYARWLLLSYVVGHQAWRVVDGRSPRQQLLAYTLKNLSCITKVSSYGESGRLVSCDCQINAQMSRWRPLPKSEEIFLICLVKINQRAICNHAFRVWITSFKKSIYLAIWCS